jgi:hypothetical protein
MASFVPGRDMLLKAGPPPLASAAPVSHVSGCHDAGRPALRPPKFGRHSATWALVDGAIRITDASLPEPAPLGDQAAALLVYLELRDTAKSLRITPAFTHAHPSLRINWPRASLCESLSC